MEEYINLIEKKFVTSENIIVFDEQFKGYLKSLFRKLSKQNKMILKKSKRAKD